MKTHEEKMRVVHALWLCHIPGQRVEDDINRARKLLCIDGDIFEDFNDDYLDRAFCSRPADWVYSDSVKFLFNS